MFFLIYSSILCDILLCSFLLLDIFAFFVRFFGTNSYQRFQLRGVKVDFFDYHKFHNSVFFQSRIC